MVSSDDSQENEHLTSENHSESNGQPEISGKSNFIFQCMKYTYRMCDGSGENDIKVTCC